MRPSYDDGTGIDPREYTSLDGVDSMERRGGDVSGLRVSATYQYDLTTLSVYGTLVDSLDDVSAGDVILVEYAYPRDGGGYSYTTYATNALGVVAPTDDAGVVRLVNAHEGDEWEIVDGRLNDGEVRRVVNVHRVKR